MNYVIISDSHSNEEYIKFLLLKYKGYKFIHCGDYQRDKILLDNNDVSYVRGNCDFSGPNDLIIEINGKKTYVTHGDEYNVKFKLDNLFYKSLELNCEYVFFGHTHQQAYLTISGVTFINPGALEDGYYITIENEKITQRKL